MRFILSFEAFSNGSSTALSTTSVARNSTLLSRIQFIKNVFKRVTESQTANIRRKIFVGKELFAGTAAPFLGLIGVNLASGNGLVTKEDEIESVCGEIRKAGSKTNSFLNQKVNDIKSVDGQLKLTNFVLGPVIDKGCSAVVYSAKTRQNESEEYPLAIKMMFNYHAESNAYVIFKAMKREILPAQIRNLTEENLDLAEFLKEEKKLPLHPNIVKMYAAFADRVPEIHGSMGLYPDALPSRINPEGLGRNMSLFLVMKKYDSSLKNYLKNNQESSGTWKTPLILLTQLLEGISHLNRNEISHRDLKSDNILLDLSDEIPRLVITDFGCSGTLKTYYPTSEIDKGGNTALMAPEIKNKKPGPFCQLDYRKADVWAAGAIAYEIFRVQNPLYVKDGSSVVLPDTVPEVIRTLIKYMLQEDPSQRLSAQFAANICQLLLWAPKSWFESTNVINTKDILQWLLNVTTKILCEAHFPAGRNKVAEYQIISTFLSRVSLNELKSAIVWIQERY